MNWEEIRGTWHQFRGKIKEKWGRLTNDDLDIIDGKREQLVGKLIERYGFLKARAEEEVDKFATKYCRESKSPPPRAANE